MNGYIEDCTIEVANYIIENKATVRAAAKHFNISKSTVHTEVSDSAVKFQIKQPLTISKADVLEVVEFDESWIQIFK